MALCQIVLIYSSIPESLDPIFITLGIPNKGYLFL